MDQIELLWKLQKHDENLKSLAEELKEYVEGKAIEDLSIKQKEVEYDLSHKKTLYEVNKAKIHRYNKKIDNLSFNIYETDKKLYSGEIKDIKQLQNLNKESAAMKDEIKKIETCTIELMEEEEVLEGEIKVVKDLYKKLDITLKETTARSKEKIEEINAKIEKENELIESFKKDIDPKLKEKYDYLSKKKNKVVAQVIDDKCDGCHMYIPSSILSKIKNSENIVNCDNCGRILFLEKVTI